MTSYTKLTKHPETGVWEMANWINDWFSMYKCGVKFPDGKIFDPDFIQLETREDSKIYIGNTGDLVDTKLVNSDGSYKKI